MGICKDHIVKHNNIENLQVFKIDIYEDPQRNSESLKVFVQETLLKHIYHGIIQAKNNKQD